MPHVSYTMLILLCRYELYTNRDEEGFHPMHLPAKEFPDFADEGGVTWPQFSEF